MNKNHEDWGILKETFINYDYDSRDAEPQNWEIDFNFDELKAHNLSRQARARATARRFKPTLWSGIPFKSYREKLLSTRAKYWYLAQKPLYLTENNLV